MELKYIFSLHGPKKNFSKGGLSLFDIPEGGLSPIAPSLVYASAVSNILYRSTAPPASSVSPVRGTRPLIAEDSAPTVIVEENPSQKIFPKCGIR